MKFKSTYACILLIALLSVSGQGFAQELRDIIQPVKINYGQADTVLVSDLFYAKDYNLAFGDNERIIITYNPKTNTAVLQPKNNFFPE